MKRLIAASLITAVALLLGSWLGAKDKPTRPKILGIVGLHFYTSDLGGARRFYSHILGKDLECRTCEEGALTPIGVWLPSEQYLEFAPAPNGTTNFLAAIDLATPDLKALDRYLKSQGIKTEGSGNYQLPTGPALTVKDPEGHQIRFVEVEIWPSPNTGALRIIHTGFIVNDRAATDHFYKDILGFRPYWHGGMKDDQDDWVAMQVPDGTDWIEYMLNISPTADHHTLGVMNHIALGVNDIHAAEKQLIANGWKPTEEPKLGRDGKWQLNLYDPDDTRTEFMEFKPAEKPCCSAFTGPHPGPK